LNKTIRIGTRGSELALWQAHFVQAELDKLGLNTAIHIISTQGDREQELSLSKLEGKGFFTKEIETALVSGEIDLAVHSHKDLETAMPEGLVIAAVSHRANPADVVIAHADAIDRSLPLGIRRDAIVGTSAARRKAQLHHIRPDLNLQDIRGNVPTRLRKLKERKFDAILLASAGLDRLKIDLGELVRMDLDPVEFIPAPAQGVLALQCRAGDTPLINALEALHHSEVATCTRIERGVLAGMNGGCHLPLGVYCTHDDHEFEVHVAIAPEWQSPLRRLTFVGDDSTGLIDLIVREIALP